MEDIIYEASTLYSGFVNAIISQLNMEQNINAIILFGTEWFETKSEIDPDFRPVTEILLVQTLTLYHLRLWQTCYLCHFQFQAENMA